MISIVGAAYGGHVDEGVTGSGRAGDGVDSMLIVLDVVARDAVLVQRLQHDVVTSSYATIKAGFKGGQTGQLPRASTTRGAFTKNSKKLLPEET